MEDEGSESSGSPCVVTFGEMTIGMGGSTIGSPRLSMSVGLDSLYLHAMDVLHSITGTKSGIWGKLFFSAMTMGDTLEYAGGCVDKAGVG